FERASGRDLKPFFRWYGQAGTPEVRLECEWDEASAVLNLRLRQTTQPTPGQSDKAALVTPIRLGLLDEEGRPQAFRAPGAETAAEEAVLVLDQHEAEVRLEGVKRAPVISALRGFSAPVKLSTDAPLEHRFVRLASDPDLFNRWEAGQNLARDLM